MDLDPRVRDVLVEIFGDKYRDRLTLDTTMDDVDEWDSAAFVDLVMALEERFDVKISMGEAAAMTDVRTIQQVLDGKRQAA